MDMMPEIPEFMKQIQIYAVSELTSRIKSALAETPELQHIAVKGEVSNFTKSHAGHIYFSLKDAGSQVRCVSFRSRAERLSYIPKEGDEVIAFGSIDVYPQGGSYQLYVDEMFHAGQGELFAKYLQLKEELEKEGLFDVERKTDIPKYPRLIGVVTSPRGAAVRDILKILLSRAPHVSVVISPSLVQGADAPPRIINALEKLLRLQPAPDTVILARGGGSFEDLFCFNDEQLVRYLSDYPLPVITGVGHESDFTLVDFVSDYRTPTPTAAAHDSVPDRDDLKEEISQLARKWDEYIREGIEGYDELIHQIMSTPVFRHPERQWTNYYQEIDNIRDRINRAFIGKVHRNRIEINSIIAILEHTNPHRLLQRGYALVNKLPDDKLVKRADELNTGDEIRVKLSRGKFTARVETVENENGKEKN